MSDMEVQLRRSNIILSYQDWFLGSILRLAEQLQSTTAEHTPTQKILHDLQEFVFSASRAGYDARQHVCHLLFNTVLRRRDAYLSDTFPRLQAPLRKQLRAHILDDSLLFSESTCETALKTFTQASNVALLSQAARASRDSSRPNPRDRQQQRQPQRQPHRPTAASRQCQPFRGKNRSLPQSSTKKGGGSGKDKHWLIYRPYVTDGPLISRFARPASTSSSSHTICSRPGRRTLTFLLAELAGHTGRWVGHLYPTGRLFFTLWFRAATHRGSTLFILLCYSPALPGHVSPHTSTPGQAGYWGDSTLNPRLLQPDLPRTQEIRRLEARHRPQRPQQVPTLSTLPHGDVRLYHAFSTARSLGYLAGLQGRLFSHPSCTHTSTLPQLPVRSPLLLVPGPPFQPGDVTVPLRPPSQGSRGLFQVPGPLLTPLSGQLEHLGPLSPSLHDLDLVAPHPIRATWPSRQHRQVRASAVSTLCVCGHRLRPGQRDGQTGSPLSAEPYALSADLHVAQGPSGRQVAATSPTEFNTPKTGPASP